MSQWLSRLYTLHPYPGLIERRQAIAAYVIATAGLVAVVVATVLASANFAAQPHMVTAVIAALISAVGSWLAIRLGFLRIARWVLLGMALAVSILPWLGQGWAEGAAPSLTQVLFLAEAMLLTSERGVLYAIGINLLGTAIISLSSLGGGSIAVVAGRAVTVASLSTFIGVLLYIAAQGWRRSLSQEGEEVVLHRLRLLQASNEVAQRISQHTDENKLLAETVELVCEHFPDIYHAQIYLLDKERRDAILHASTGRAALHGQKLAVGSQTVIGQATLTGEAVLTYDTSTDPAHQRYELLPHTRTELALPLIIGREIIGSLDVQSTISNAFLPDDVAALQTLANQLAVAIANARLFSNQQRIIAENQRLMKQAQSQIEQIQDLNRRLTKSAWDSYLKEQDLAPALTIDFESGAMTPNAEWTANLKGASTAGALIQKKEAGKQIVAVPLSVRGQVVGAMEFELDGDAALNTEETALVQDVADRLALSLESARLYADAQRIAQREAVINELGARLQSAAGMDGALVTAAQGLQSTLDAPRIAIRLGTPPPATDGGAPAEQEEHA